MILIVWNVKGEYKMYRMNTKWTLSEDQVDTSGHPSDFDGLSLYIDDMIE